MISIIVVLPKIEEAKGIRNLLVRSGYTVAGVCTSGARALAFADEINYGIVLCGYRLTDMIYSQLYDDLPEGMEMLLVASENVLGNGIEREIVTLSMPLKVQDLLNTVGMLVQTQERRRKKQRMTPRERKPEEEALIREAKGILMEHNHMTEEDAHRYIQKCSMDSGTNMAETAQMILTMLQS